MSKIVELLIKYGITKMEYWCFPEHDYIKFTFWKDGSRYGGSLKAKRGFFGDIQEIYSDEICLLISKTFEPFRAYHSKL